MMDFKDLKDGMRFKCTCYGVKLEGKIAILDDSDIYLCHDDDSYDDSYLIQFIRSDGRPYYKTLNDALVFLGIENFRILNRREKLEQLLKDLEE